VNPAIFLFTFLGEIRRFSKSDIVFHVLMIIGLFALCKAPHPATVIASVIDLITNPAILVLISWRFCADFSTKSGEYQALLFTRPLTRSSYIFTRALVAWVGTMVFVGKALLVILLGQLAFGIKPLTFISGWDAINIIANSFSFGCLGVLVYKLSTKWSSIFYLMMFGTYFGSTVNSGALKLTGAMQGASVPAEAMVAGMKQAFYPAIDFEAVFHASQFSIVPFLAYASNILIYLTVATILLSRREFSYAED
jgi:hypothetical protein